MSPLFGDREREGRLVERRSFGGRDSNASTYRATRLGETALADGTAQQYLTPANGR